MSYGDIARRLERLEEERRAPEREFTALETSTRLAAILAMEDGCRELNPRRLRIRAIVEGATARAALA